MVFSYTTLRAPGKLCTVFQTCRDHRIRNQSPSKSLISASLIPRDPVPNQKYQAKAPINPSKVQDLSAAPGFGPKGILLFGFDPKEEHIIRNWLSEILVVLSFNGVSDPSHSGTVSTLGDALEKLEQSIMSKSSSNLSLEYFLDDYLALTSPIVIFSGLEGAETIALLEAWQDFTGLERPAAATAVDGLQKRRLNSLLADIVRAQTPDAMQSSKVTVMTKSGAQEIAHQYPFPITDSMTDAEKAQKGRGFQEAMDTEERQRGDYESLPQEGGGPGPARSVEGWVVFATGIHEEAQEEDIHDAFSEFGEVKNIHLNLDRRTGYVKGYAVVEYTNKDDAKAAIDALNGKELLTQVIHVDWAFTSGPKRGRK